MNSGKVKFCQDVMSCLPSSDSFVTLDFSDGWAQLRKVRDKGGGKGDRGEEGGGERGSLTFPNLGLQFMNESEEGHDIMC